MEHDRNSRGKSAAAQGSDELKRMHREIEKQRRQEMSSHFSSLRSLLPLEHLKGKRSVSDQMNEAVKYINHLQNKIKQMELKRDHLKRCTSSSDGLATVSTCSRSSDLLPDNIISVKVSPRPGGVDVSIVRSATDEGFRLSRVLEVLVNIHGLDVINCYSAEVNRRVFHTISLQVSDAIYVDCVVLQQLLSQVIENVGRA